MLYDDISETIIKCAVVGLMVGTTRGIMNAHQVTILYVYRYLIKYFNRVGRMKEYI